MLRGWSHPSNIPACCYSRTLLPRRLPRQAPSNRSKPYGAVPSLGDHSWPACGVGVLIFAFRLLDRLAEPLRGVDPSGRGGRSASSSECRRGPCTPERRAAGTPEREGAERVPQIVKAERAGRERGAGRSSPPPSRHTGRRGSASSPSIEPSARPNTRSSGPVKSPRRERASSALAASSISGTDRTLPDFGAPSSPPAGMLRWTWIVAATKSTSRQRSARSSPVRSPV